jgi:membrane dipeptidase
MLAIKKTGGVVQIVAFDTYLKDPPEEKKEALQALRKKFNVSSATWAKLSPEVKEAYQAERYLLHEKWPRANLNDFIAHIDYAVNLIGIDHVGIASDFGGGGGIDGWNDASETENVTMHLIASGYSNREIEKLWGKNMLRVMTQVEKYARSQR